MDYGELGTVVLELQPGQTSVCYNVTIIDDAVTEIDHETFTLNLQTDQHIFTLDGFNQVKVTIKDNDSKSHQS